MTTETLETPAAPKNILVAIPSFGDEKAGGAFSDMLNREYGSREVTIAVHEVRYDLGEVVWSDPNVMSSRDNNRQDNEDSLRRKLGEVVGAIGVEQPTVIAVGEAPTSLAFGALAEPDSIVSQVVAVDSGINAMTEQALPTPLRTRKVRDVRTGVRPDTTPTFLNGVRPERTHAVPAGPTDADPRLSRVRAAMNALGVRRNVQPAMAA